MNKKPNPTTAARLVHAHLKQLGALVSDRQSKDLVAIVEGYANWRAFQPASAKKKRPRTVEGGDAPTPYAQAWAAVHDTLKQRMLALYEAVLGYFGAAIVNKNLTLWLPILDQENEEWSCWLRLDDAEGRTLFTATLALVEDDSEDSEGFSVRFELEAPGEDRPDRPLMSWVATSRFGPGVWVPLSEIQTLVEKVNEDLSAAEAVYALQDAGIFR